MYNQTALCILVSILIVSVRSVPNESDLLRIGSKSYYITAVKTNFYAARDHCNGNDADLATFDSIAELDAVSNYLIQNGFNSESNDFFWLSYWDLGRAKGLFRSIATGELMTTSRWTKGQPNNSGGVQHCVHLWKKNGVFGMNDNKCTEKFRALCQQRTYSFPQKCCQHSPIYDIYVRC